jgi:hypothetical protein
MTPFAKHSVAESQAIYLVNVVHVDEGQQDAALEILRSAVTYVARTYPSFAWSRLLKSIDGKTVINQAMWHDQAEFESLFEDCEFNSRYLRLKETGSWEFHLYRVTDYIPSAYEPAEASLQEAKS